MPVAVIMVLGFALRLLCGLLWVVLQQRLYEVEGLGIRRTSSLDEDDINIER